MTGSDAVLVLIERGYTHLPIVLAAGKYWVSCRSEMLCRVKLTALKAKPSFVIRSTMRRVGNHRNCRLLAAAFVQLPLGAGPSQRRFDHHAFLVKYGEVGVR